ncbi:MAG: rane protein [Gemmatimonadetes bacterium]|nr:rane protein [Gemmatimonadota bacterium]
MLREIELKASAGLPTLLLFFILLILALGGMGYGGRHQMPLVGAASLLAVVVIFVSFAGFFVVNPGEAKAVQLFGQYKGTVRTQGFWWANPFFSKKLISLRIRNFETQKLKVNDSRANPIEIAAIVVWKVVDTAEALFEVDSFATYVAVQSESAVRAVAQSYPYDSHGENEEALSTHTAEVSMSLQKAVQDRLARAGVDVVEARISHLAYSPEIAQAMLQRQQAGAIIAARSRIVEGAVGMVEHALEMLSQKGIVVLDEERKAQMVSNLLVVLCSERAASPVVNAGSIFG